MHVIPLAAMLLLGLTTSAGAAETADWRPTYDLVMRWVNFLIMVFIIIKFMRKPLADFIAGKQREVKSDVDFLEQKKEEALAQKNEAEKELAASSQKLKEIKRNIIAQGEKRKEQIIQDANREVEMLFKSLQAKIEGDIEQSKLRVKNDMVDKAMELALKRLPEMITAKDNQHLIDQFIAEARQ
jgi:F-type H+-transporting ATPase subunit b